MAATLTRDRLMTPEEFWDFCIGRDGRIDLIDGRVIEMPPVAPEHGSLDVRLTSRLGLHVEEHGLGRVYLNTGFILRRDPPLTLGPDEAFVAAERIARNPPPTRGFWEIAPDLAVEIVSPEDRPATLRRKIAEYLDAGVRLVWLVDPLRRQVEVFRPQQAVRILDEADTLDGEDVVPGFSLPLSQLWG
jgi:Uma2 family endonuclease